jgi:Zn-dependent metalloprotease
MRKGFVVALSLFFASSCYAFDYSPTQTPQKKITRRAPKQISPKLISDILEDQHLSKGTKLMATNGEGNGIETISGSLSDPLNGDLVKATKKFILSHPNVFNVPTTRDDNTLKLVKSESDGGADHFFYQMNMSGVPVHEAIIGVHVGKDKRVQLANGSFPTIREITNQISLSRVQAISAAQRAVGIKKVRSTPKAEMVVFPQNDKAVMAFNVKIPSAEPLGDYEIIVDAETGKELYTLNQMVFLSANTGRGKVYVNHPDAGPVTEEPLANLTAPTLKGLYANVLNEDTDEASNEEGIHLYDPTDTHFDEVNIYYYINQIHAYFKTLGFNKLDTPLKATVHVGDKYDNAYFSPMENALAFGDGNRLNPLSREESVCYHEYGHAHLNQIVRLNYSAESGAMNEGQADYFACSFTNDPALGEYVMKKLNRPYLRHMENNKRYPDDIKHEVHADGEIWGAVLWDIRKALGAPVSDLIIEKSFSYLKPGSPKFINGAAAIITADKNINDGKNVEKLTEVFKKRGITVSAIEGNVLGEQDIQRMMLFKQVHNEE